jgi:O-antigen/teichoic acid export membrane protein
MLSQHLLIVQFTKSIAAHLRHTLGASQYLRDVLWQGSGNAAAQVLGIAVMPVLTRLYAPSDFAALNLFSQLVAALAIFLTLRFEYLVMLPADQKESDRVLWLTFRLGAVHIIWLTPLLAVLPGHWPWLQSQGDIANWLWLAPVSAWALSLSVGFQQAVQRKGDFRASATSDFFGRCVYVVCTLLGAMALPSIAGLMISTLANASGKLAWLLRVGGTQARSIWQCSDASIANSVRRMAWSTSASNLIALVSGLAPMIFIADKYGSNALGQYGLVMSTLYLPVTLLGQAIGQVYYQRACQLHREGNAFNTLLIATTLNLSKVGIPLYALVAAIAPFAYPFVFGADWTVAGEMARWLCIAAAAGFISTPFDRTSIVVNAWWYLMCWHSIRAIATCFVLLGVTHFDVGLQGCVAALSIQVTLIYLADYLASYWFAHRGDINETAKC